MQAPLFFSLFFKVLVSNPRPESQAVWAVFAFQGLSARPMPTTAAETRRRTWIDKTT